MDTHDIWKEKWIKIDEQSWQERSQHPSPLVVCDFIESLLATQKKELAEKIAQYTPEFWNMEFTEEEKKVAVEVARMTKAQIVSLLTEAQ